MNMEQRKTELLNLIGGPKCRWCGSEENIEFDHIFRDDKLFVISSTKYYPSPKVIAEVLKCQPLCTSCHMIKTSLESAPRPEFLPRTRAKQKKYREDFYRRHPGKSYKSRNYESRKYKPVPPKPKVIHPDALMTQEQFDQMRQEIFNDIGVWIEDNPNFIFQEQRGNA